MDIYMSLNTSVHMCQSMFIHKQHDDLDHQMTPDSDDTPAQKWHPYLIAGYGCAGTCQICPLTTLFPTARSPCPTHAATQICTHTYTPLQEESHPSRTSTHMCINICAIASIHACAQDGRPSRTESGRPTGIIKHGTSISTTNLGRV